MKIMKEEKYELWRHWYIKDGVLKYIDSEFEEIDLPNIEIIESELIKRIEI